jgi:hypothetical protein
MKECNAPALQEKTAVTLVLGALSQLWLYADEHIRDDNTIRASVDDIDQFIGIENFCHILPTDWLKVVDPDYVELPDFLEHNGSVAKKKALNQQAVARHRAKANGHAPALPEDSACNAPPLPDQTRPSQSKNTPALALNGHGLNGHPTLSGEPDPVAQVFAHWQRTWDKPKSKLDPKRKAAILKALKTYDVKTLCDSISGYRNSKHHRGDNERNTVYDDVELFLRDAKHIDAGISFLAQSTNAGGGSKEIRWA